MLHYVILSLIGNILEDENAIKNLSSSKVLSNEILEKQQIASSTSTRINENRYEYLTLTNYAVTLFFSGSVLSSVNHMYQFSLSWFTNLFCASLDAADKSEDLSERMSNIRAHFLSCLFANTSCGLFEEDKLVYSFTLTCNLCRDEAAITNCLWKLLLNVGESNEDGGDDQFGPKWMSEQDRQRLNKLRKVELFQKCFESLQGEYYF